MGAKALVPVCCSWSGRPAAGCCRLWAAALGGRAAAPAAGAGGACRGLLPALRAPCLAPRRGGSPSGLPFKIVTFSSTAISGGRAVGRPPRCAALGVPRPACSLISVIIRPGAALARCISFCAARKNQHNGITIHISKTQITLDILNKGCYNNIGDNIKMI